MTERKTEFWWASIGGSQPEPVEVTEFNGRRVAYTCGCADPFYLDEELCIVKLITAKPAAERPIPMDRPVLEDVLDEQKRWEQLQVMYPDAVPEHKECVMTSSSAISLVERLIQAAVDYEQADGFYVPSARKELADARALVERSLVCVAAARNAALEEAVSALVDLHNEALASTGKLEALGIAQAVDRVRALKTSEAENHNAGVFAQLLAAGRAKRETWLQIEREPPGGIYASSSELWDTFMAQQRLVLELVDQLR